MSKQPLISIIIPTYNRAHYLIDALDSIKHQTYTHWECLVVDDGSTDNTSLLMIDYCSKNLRFKYFKRSPDYPKGSNGSRNFGLDNSKGAYIAFCDDDDYWLQDKLEKQLIIFEQHPEVGLVTGNIEFVNSDGLRTGRVIKQTGNHGYVFKELLFKNRLSMITPVLKKEVFEKVGYFNTDFTISEDWEYWRRVAYYYPFYALSDVLACVRKHDSNTSLIVTQTPYSQYVRYRKLTRALLKWGEGRFVKADKMLIAKVEAKRYRQLLSNHCPGTINKCQFFYQVSSNSLKDSFQLLYLLIRFGIFNR